MQPQELYARGERGVAILTPAGFAALDRYHELTDRIEQLVAENDRLRASHEPCPVTEADEASAFHRWWNVEIRALFVVAYGPDEPFEKHPGWGDGHMKYAKDGWMARAKLSATPPPGHEVPILRNLLGNLYMAVLRRAEFRGEADLQFAMKEAAQGLGEPYSTATKISDQGEQQ